MNRSENKYPYEDVLEEEYHIKNCLKKELLFKDSLKEEYLFKDSLKEELLFKDVKKKKYPLEGFIDTHIHTAPDVKPRILNDVEAANMASQDKMGAIVIKSHIEPTSGRANIAEYLTGFKVFGGVCLNHSVGGLNPDAVRTVARMGGKLVWLPTTSYTEIEIEEDKIEEILHIAAENDLVLGTGHLSVFEIFQVLDLAKSLGLQRIIVNHPLTRVVDASMDEQREMSRYAYLEHCYVACMPLHDGLNPEVMAEAIKEVGAGRCIMATDFGQAHNPPPAEGMKLFVEEMLKQGVSWKEITTMCVENPGKLLFG